MKKLHLLLILVVVLTAAFAAAPVLAEEGEDAGMAPVNIYIVSHGACSWDAFWCVEEKGNKDAAEDLDVDITLITPDRFNPEQTAQDVDKALAAVGHTRQSARFDVDAVAQWGGDRFANARFQRLFRDPWALPATTATEAEAGEISTL